MNTIPSIVLGATGYVGGELLRLLATHPRLRLAAAVSREPAGRTVGETFAHLAPIYATTPFVGLDEALASVRRNETPMAVFCALPHGDAAATLASFADAGGDALHIVDVSADFRFRDVDRYAEVYGVAHGAPAHAALFTATLPELTAGTPTRHVAHPGCFATAMLLAAAPLVQAKLGAHDLFLTGVTGSTGSGKTPTATTHHPTRHSNFFAYKALTHRHAPEVESVLASTVGGTTRIHFVPHSGPIARGIIVNLQTSLPAAIAPDALRTLYRDFYRDAAFVRVRDTGVRLRNVVGSNYAELSVASDGASIAISCVIDNLVKGAAGGAVQWMNRLHGLDETAGLTAPAIGWA